MHLRSLFALALLLVAAPAFGDDAETLFREGRKALEAGDFAVACAKFAESQRLEPAPGTLLNLAGCEERSGKLVASAEHYRLAAAGFPKQDTRRAVAIDKASALDKRVGHLVLHKKNLPDGARVRNGDTPVTIFEAPLAVDPGTQALVVEAEGRAPATFDTPVAEGSTVEVTLTVGAPQASLATAPKATPVVRAKPDPADRPATSSRRTLGFVVGGVGGAALVGGTIFGVWSLARAGTYRSHCDGQNVCDQDGFDAASDLKWMTPLSTVLVIGGAALVATGLVLYFTAPKSAKTNGRFDPVVRF